MLGTELTQVVKDRRDWMHVSTKIESLRKLEINVNDA